MKIVFLDAKTIGDDIDLSGFDSLGEVTKYNFTTPEEAPERVKDADVLIINKVPINENTVGTAKNLKLVCVTATGTNNLDKDYLDSHKIAWRNVAGYSTETLCRTFFRNQWQDVGNHRTWRDRTPRCPNCPGIWCKCHLLFSIRTPCTGWIYAG